MDTKEQGRVIINSEFNKLCASYVDAIKRKDAQLREEAQRVLSSFENNYSKPSRRDDANNFDIDESNPFSTNNFS